MTLADAIATFEGWGKAGTLASKNNNPGDIVYGDYAARYGAVKDTNSQFAVFPDTSIGFQALNDLLASPSYAGLSLADAISRWNGNGSNSGTYASYVSQQTGIPLDATIGEYAGMGTSSNVGSGINSAISNVGSYASDIVGSFQDSGSGWIGIAIAVGLGILVWEIV